MSGYLGVENDGKEAPWKFLECWKYSTFWLVEVVVIWIIHVKTHQIIHRKWMHFIVCKLHLNKVGF